MNNNNINTTKKALDLFNQLFEHIATIHKFNNNFKKEIFAGFYCAYKVLMTNLRFNKTNKKIKIFNNKSTLTEDQKQDVKAKKSVVDEIFKFYSTQFLENKRIAYCKGKSNIVNRKLNN